MGKLLSDQVLKPSEQGYRRAVNRNEILRTATIPRNSKATGMGSKNVQVGRITNVLQTALSADKCGSGERAGVRQQAAMTGLSWTEGPSQDSLLEEEGELVQACLSLCSSSLFPQQKQLYLMDHSGICGGGSGAGTGFLWNG